MADRPYKSLSDVEISKRMFDIEDEINYLMEQVNDLESELYDLEEEMTSRTVKKHSKEVADAY